MASAPGQLPRHPLPAAHAGGNPQLETAGGWGVGGKSRAQPGRFGSEPPSPCRVRLGSDGGRGTARSGFVTTLLASVRCFLR